MFKDPRYYQIIVLGSLLTYGKLFLDFDIGLWEIIITIGTTQLWQFFAQRIFQSDSYSILSSLISSLSLCLLLRTQHWPVIIFVSFFTIFSKFLFRYKEKHFFNPTNFGLAIGLLLMPQWVWLSPGQWGNQVLLAFFVACCGMFVAYRSVRLDVALAFLGFFIMFLVSRSLYVGEPMAIAFHRVQSGSLLLFSFFMISDPRTTPNHGLARIVFAFIVALMTYVIQFHFYKPNAPIWALVMASPLTPLLDRVLAAKPFEWPKKEEAASATSSL